MKKDDNPIKELSDHGEKNNLSKKIAILKGSISLLENIIQIPSSAEKSPRKSSRSSHNCEISHNIPDGQMELLCDFHLTGMRCTKLEQKSSFVFDMCSKENVTENDSYMVEILINNEGHAKLNKSVLPISVDVKKILSQYPIDNMNNVKHFLNKCKHHVDCYNSRVKQFKNLQNLVSGIACIKLDSTKDYNKIFIRMSHIKNMYDIQSYVVTLHLEYKSDEIRPYKLFSVIEEQKVSSSRFIILKKLNKFFEPFLKLKLCSALLHINTFNKEHGLIWINTMPEKHDVEIYEEESKEVIDPVFRSYLFRCDKQQEISKNKREYHTDILHKDAKIQKHTETSLCIPKEKSNNVCFMQDENDIV